MLLFILNRCFLATIMLVSNNHTDKSAKKAWMMIHFDVTRANSHDSVMTTNSLMTDMEFHPIAFTLKRSMIFMETYGNPMIF